MSDSLNIPTLELFKSNQMSDTLDIPTLELFKPDQLSDSLDIPTLELFKPDQLSTNSLDIPTLELFKPDQRSDTLDIPTLELFKPDQIPLRLPYRPHKCNLCSKTFYSIQALGGHQNAHRSEKNERKKPKKDKKRAKSQPNPPSDSPFELKIAPDDDLLRKRKPKKMKDSSSKAMSTAHGGSSRKCVEKVGNSLPLFVARFRINEGPDTAVVVDSSLPQVQLPIKEIEGDNIQELGLSFKL